MLSNDVNMATVQRTAAMATELGGGLGLILPARLCHRFCRCQV